MKVITKDISPKCCERNNGNTDKFQHNWNPKSYLGERYKRKDQRLQQHIRTFTLKKSIICSAYLFYIPDKSIGGEMERNVLKIEFCFHVSKFKR